MRNLNRVFSCLALVLGSGCSTLERPLTDAALGAGGAYIGDALSHGNPAAIAGGAAGGVLLGEGLNAWQSRKTNKAYNDGYVRGRSDGVKRLYWSLQDQQQHQSSAESFKLYDVTIPEHWEDGVLVKPTTRTIRIQD